MGPQGYHIEWLDSPRQVGYTACPQFSKEETESLEVEINQIVRKGAITAVHPSTEEGFLAGIFLLQKMMGDTDQ